MADMDSEGAESCLSIRPFPFDHGLLPLQDLIFPEPSSSLRPFRLKMHLYSSNLRRPPRINTAGISLCLGILYEDAHLLLHTFASVAPESDPLFHSPLVDIDSVGAHIDDLISFLYIQNYRRSPIRPHHKDSLVAVEDVWPLNASPSTPPPSPAHPIPHHVANAHAMKAKKAAAPSHADEEAHRLSYMHKHLPALLALLAQPPFDNTSSDAQTFLSEEQFNHLGFLIQPRRRGSMSEPLSRGIPLFKESSSVLPLEEVLEWVLQHLCARSDPSQGRYPHCNAIGCSRIQDFTIIDGLTKVSYMKDEANIIRSSIKVTNCHDSAIYILAPLRYVSISGCSDCTIVVGAVGKAVHIEHCERVQLIAATVRICITSCRECRFNLAVNEAPVIIGENHSLQIGPYNTCYPKLEAHLREVGFELHTNKWDELMTFGAVDPHDSIVHVAGVADAPAEGASLLPADHFTNFVIPNDGKSYRGTVTKWNPFRLPRPYSQSQSQRNKAALVLKDALESLRVNEHRKRYIAHIMRMQFKEWLISSGNIRQLYEVHKDVE